LTDADRELALARTDFYE